tara:strand:+ start:38 stop:487 length:450 start_codon:yes stop_codon:yes gene_type:complete
MKFKYLGIIVLGLLMSCIQQPKQEIELKALDEFWKKLGRESTTEKVINWDTKVYYDLIWKPKGKEYKVETDFNYQVHIYLCHRNREYDSINGKGHFEKLAILSAKDGMIPCPIGVHPDWDYDWEEHIIKFKDTKEAKRQLGRGFKGQQG